MATLWWWHHQGKNCIWGGTQACLARNQMGEVEEQEAYRLVVYHSVIVYEPPPKTPWLLTTQVVLSTYHLHPLRMVWAAAPLTYITRTLMSLYSQLKRLPVECRLHREKYTIYTFGLGPIIQMIWWALLLPFQSLGCMTLYLQSGTVEQA